MGAIGDNIEIIEDGGLQALEFQFDKGAGLAWYKLMPATLEEYYINRGMPEGEDTLDDTVHVAWYKHFFRIRFGQTDPETLDELYSSTIQTAWHTTGVPVRFTFQDGNQATVTMHLHKVGGVGSKGPGDWRGVVIEGNGHTLSPVDFTP